MHEIALCAAILEQLEEQARAQKFQHVKQLWLEIGALSCVDAEALRFGFELACRGTLAEGARVHIERTPGRGWCSRCQAEMPLNSLLDPLLQTLWMLLEQIARAQATVENQCTRVAASQGNPAAVAAVRRVFHCSSAASSTDAGVRLREPYAAFDAERRFGITAPGVTDPLGGPCGEVLKGVLHPRACAAFATLCTPQHPLGASMVSAEGACAACYTDDPGRQRRQVHTTSTPSPWPTAVAARPCANSSNRFPSRTMVTTSSPHSKTRPGSTSPPWWHRETAWP